MTSRRRLLRRLAAVFGAAGLSGCSNFLAQRAEAPTADLPPNPRAGKLPYRQHAWNDQLKANANGNPLLPQYYRVFLLDLKEDPSSEAAATVELAMRTLEAAFEFRGEELLHMLGWGTNYFERLNGLGASPIRKPQVLSRTAEADLLSFDAALVLASDVPSQLQDAEETMFGSRKQLGDETVEERLGDVFTVAQKRTGFIGEGLPAAHASAEGVPDDIPGDAPTFTGFFSGRSGTQPSEDRATIDGGRHDGGTTMHLSHLRESLDTWWSMAESDRVKQMFSSGFSPEDIAGDALPFPTDVEGTASDEGKVGHWEKVVRARKDGKPRILRRDFNTVDGGQAGVHFLSLQEDLDDFKRTRKAMNGWWLRDEHDGIKDQSNNGILEFIDVVSRANFYVPPRDERSFPDA